MNRKPAANIYPIKETPSLNTTSYLRKRLRQAESELPVDMRLIHELSSISRNPFSTEALKSPVVTELNFIGQGNPRAIESGTHTQSIIDGRNGIIQSDVITHPITDHSQMSLKGDSFPFDKKEASTLMFTPFVEAFLTRNQHICTTGIVGASRPNHSRIFSPGIHEDILSGNNV